MNWRSTKVNTSDKAKKSAARTPFSEAEIEAVAASSSDSELDEVDAVEIDERDSASDAPFEKLVQQAKRLSTDRVRTVVQSLLFVSDKPLSLEQLYESTGIERPLLEAALEQLVASHREGESGIVLHEVDAAWQFRTDPHSAEYVRRFLRVKPQRLTRAALETLAIIAYRQPVTRPEVEDIRGVDSGAVIKALLDRRLIKILGKKEEVGRPMLYGTTREFLEFFALKDLSSLPTLREFHELTEEHQEIVEKESPAVEGTVAQLSDPSFQQKLDETQERSEEALRELEHAMSGVDQRAKATAALLGDNRPADSRPAAEQK
jgi:segregation and condensation protein B